MKKTVKKVTKKVQSKAALTSAVHLQHGNNHVVGVDALTVLLTKDGSCWFAQGLQIDYASSGASVDEAKANFEQGLMLTIREHLKVHGHIKNFLKVAPQEAWDEYFSAKASTECQKQKFTTVQSHRITVDAAQPAITTGFPFKEVTFVEMPQAAAA